MTYTLDLFRGVPRAARGHIGGNHAAAVRQPRAGGRRLQFPAAGRRGALRRGRTHSK